MTKEASYTPGQLRFLERMNVTLAERRKRGKSKAIAAWNTRTPDPELTTLRARVKELEGGLAPFAELDADLGGRYFYELLVYPEGDVPADGTKHWGPAIRRARTLLKGAAS